MAGYVDIYRTDGVTARKHLLREELTQSLVAKDSRRFINSIFQSSYETKVTEFAEIDTQLIRLLYHPEMEAGLNEDQVHEKLQEIIEDVVPSE